MTIVQITHYKSEWSMVTKLAKCARHHRSYSITERCISEKDKEGVEVET